MVVTIRMDGSLCHCWLNKKHLGQDLRNWSTQPQFLLPITEMDPNPQAEWIFTVLVEEVNLAFVFTNLTCSILKGTCLFWNIVVWTVHHQHTEATGLVVPAFDSLCCCFYMCSVTIMSPSWCLICRVGGAHTLRGGFPEIRGLCSFRGFW